MRFIEAFTRRFNQEPTVNLAERFKTFKTEDEKARTEALLKIQKKVSRRSFQDILRERVKERKEAHTDELADKAPELFMPTLDAINEAFADNQGEVGPISQSVDHQTVELKLKWDPKVIRVGGQMTRSGPSTSYNKTIWRSVHFSLKRGLFGLSAEFGSPTNKMKINPTKKNWEQKLARKIYSIANAENSRYLG